MADAFIAQQIAARIFFLYFFFCYFLSEARVSVWPLYKQLVPTGINILMKPQFYNVAYCFHFTKTKYISNNLFQIV